MGRVDHLWFDDGLIENSVLNEKCESRAGRVGTLKPNSDTGRAVGLIENSVLTEKCESRAGRVGTLKPNSDTGRAVRQLEAPFS